MRTLVQCPSCRGLLRKGRKSCPHCEFRPPSGRAVALGLAAAAGFAALTACCVGPVAAYGICMQPDGNYCGAGEVTDGGPDAG